MGRWFGSILLQLLIKPLSTVSKWKLRLIKWKCNEQDSEQKETHEERTFPTMAECYLQ